MKKLLLISLLFLFAGAAFGQSAPPCNNFDATGVPVLAPGSPYPAAIVAPYNYNCTDYFGSGNWANSPLPSSPITGFTLIAGGTGYANPLVTIVDSSGAGASATATATAGVITGVTLVTPGTGYVVPQVTIVDVGAGGTLALPTCGGAAPQPACGSGAMVTTVLGGPYTGGMLKFQDPLKDLKTVIPTADVATFPGSDYYEIAVVKYTQKMHASLPATTLLGYEQLPSGSVGCPAPILGPTYLGPTIVATKGRPVRVKFTNCLPVGPAGNLFIPSDTTYMGAGTGPDGTSYTENRAELHLHGGATPWISDGTPHQWTVPVGETATLQKGAGVAYVPDMWFDGTTGAVISSCAAQPTCAVVGATNNPGQGSLSYYWTNEQGGRLMFYHDHAYGITRLNVYAGEAAGYLLADPVEENALAAATVPGTVGTVPDLAHLIPLVIQDKTFVPSAAQISQQDPTWAANFGTKPGTLAGQGANLGDLWFSHVYMTNQNPADTVGGANGFGRWDYGAWFFPPMTSMTAAGTPPGSNFAAVTVPCTSSAFPGQLITPTPACPSCGCPITPNPSGTPESFMDTPVVNGVAYPVLHVAPEAYRFRILSVGNDRSQNLSWFVADPTQLVNGIPTEVAMLPAVPPSTGSVLPLCGAINPVAVPALKIGLATGLLDATGNPLNGTGLPAGCWPNYGATPGIPAPQTMWAADGRLGGAPDPRKAGPAWIQIGSEGGLLPAPVVIPPTPIQYEQNTRSITITSVAVHGLWLGPAERADAIVDFSKAPALCAAQVPPVSPCTLILYNDAPTPAPAFDSRLDYFTGDGDQSPIGGAPNTPPGYGPNTRTIMQVIVDLPTTGAPAFNLNTLNAAFASTATTTGLFAQTQPTTIVPEPFYNSAYNKTFPTTQMGIGVDNLTFTPIAPLTFDQPPCGATAPAQCAVLGQKAIQELFTLDYGRMNATMGTELPLTNFLVQTTLPYGYAEWPTELTQGGQTALWKVTHNGVDSHFIHFHLFNVQVVNRVGWDGSLRPIDANEAGWKETVRMNPLEDVLVALQPITPSLPFPLPDSIRPLDVTRPVPFPDADTNPTPPGGPMSGIDPNTGNAIVGPGTINAYVNFGWEYVWHCHILGHEENDMMRPIIHQVAPPAPTNMLAANPDPLNPSNVIVTWGDNSASETSFTLQRDTLPTFNTANLTTWTVTGGNSAGFSTPAFGTTVTFNDTIPIVGAYYYRVRADDDFTPSSPLTGIFHPLPLSSGWSNIATLNAVPLTPTVTFTGAPLSAVYNSTFVVTATTNSTSIPTITGTAGVCTVSGQAGTAASTTATVTMTSGTGICTLTANWAADPFFLAATRTQTTNATPAPLTITANNLSKGYGATLTFLGTEFTATGLLNGNTVASVTLTSAGTIATAAAGPYPITPSAAVAGPLTVLTNYTITYVNGTLTVNPVALTITANSTSKAYGTLLTFLGTEFTATGLLNSDTVTSVTLTSVGAAATATVAASPYPIVPSAAVGTGLTNYTITYVNGTLTVNPVALTITAKNASKAYGTLLTFLGTEFTATGLLNTDTVTSVTLTSAGAPVTATVAASPYPVVPSAAVGTGLTNYTITYVNGTLTVNPVALTITANSLSKAYGTLLTFLGTEFTATGLLNTDTVTGVTLTSAGAVATAATGPYPIVPSAAVGTGLANYTITYVNGTLTVNPAALTITAKPASKAYGSTLTFLGTEFTATGLLNTDTVTSVTLTSAGAVAAAAVGPYPIVPSAAVGTGLTNYTITYVNGTLTVNPVPLTITANSTVKTYGQTLTFLGTEFIATGLLNGNTVTSVTLTSAGAAAAAVPGPYPIVASAAVGAGLTNYTIIYVAGALTVSKATTITTITSNVPNPSIRGQVVTFNFTVAPQFTGVPSGSVTATASTLETCTATPTLGAGSCTLTFLTGGSRTVTAVYTGDTNFLGSTSAAVTQTVSSVDLSTTALLFGNQFLNTTSASQAVTLTNVGTTPLSMTAIGVSGNFAQSNNCPLGGTLGVGRSCRINVTFTPTSLGVLAGTLTITDVDASSPQLVSLTGTGVDPSAVLSPTSLNFGTIPRGNSLTLPITLSNVTGTAALTINRISFGGANPRQFTQTNNCGGSLAAGTFCTINVTFSTSRLGRPATYNATLNVSDNAPGSPQSAALTGTSQ